VFTLLFTMFYSLASILLPIHWLARLGNVLILIRLLYALATQVTWSFIYPLHLNDKVSLTVFSSK